jgi:pimeloyl-ACP methyl ester carboxylesterase
MDFKRNGMKEKVILFGKTNSLVGHITSPSFTGDVFHQPGVILLNPGLTHRVGPNRLFVKIARSLSERGYHVFRFDYSGTGDSLVRKDNRPFKDLASSETQEAMDYLAGTKGIHQFILIGLCSGACIALHTARSDSRVIGAILAEGPGFKTRRYYWNRYGKRFLKNLLSLQSWKIFLQGKSFTLGVLSKLLVKQRNFFLLKNPNELGHILNGAVPKPVELANRWDLPGEPKTQNQLASVSERGVHLLLVYVRNHDAHWNFSTDLHFPTDQPFEYSKNMKVVLMEHTDHNYASEFSHEMFIKVIIDFLKSINKTSLLNQDFHHLTG